jgi:lysophospholipid acyltransferase (LPLAT)-like uncharacterized protein
MKLRNRHLIKLVAFILAWFIYIWVGTVRLRYRRIGANILPGIPENRGRKFIYCFWHETILAPACFFGHFGIHILISQHADGELITEICRHLGHPAVRGSTTRGGAAALFKMVEVSRKGKHLAITPDGPRGPRRCVNGAVAAVAAKTGLPIVPAGFAFRRPWRMKSWDKFAIPVPWSLCTLVTAPAITVSPDASREELESARRHLEIMMRWAIEAAEHEAEGLPWPPLPEPASESTKWRAAG